MRPGDRLIAALIGDHRAGDTFAAWPLHVTVVAWFASALPSDVLAQTLAGKLRGVAPFTATAGGEQVLGYRNKKTVTMVRTPTPFAKIRRRVVSALDELGIQPVDVVGSRPYKPHVTVQKDARLHPGAVFRVERLFIVAQQGGYKQVAAEVPLRG